MRALEEKGIGRPSTYAPTISTILARGYVMREKKQLFPTELGIMITNMMEEYFADIVDIAFTAGMEEQLDEVEEGKLDWHKVLSDFYGPFEKTLENAEAKIEKVEIKDEVSMCPCDKCGAMMVYKLGRYGRFWPAQTSRTAATRRRFRLKSTRPARSAAASSCRKTSRKGRKFYGCERYRMRFRLLGDAGSGEVPEVRKLHDAFPHEKGRFPHLCERNLPRAHSRAAGRERMMERAIVIGAGLAGCEAAWQLAQRGVP